MKINNFEYRNDENSVLNYYEIKNDKPKLLLLHAQGTDSMSYEKCLKKLSKKYHIYLVDYYGHGKSSHNRDKYNLISIGNDIISFIENVVQDNVTVLGHSSGGLIAAYIASNCDKCCYLILEDPPLFSCVGERRYNTYNYIDLSTVCHKFISQNEAKDFVHYYFMNQYCWNFFPEESRENIKQKLGELALKYREKHPDKNLKVPFWPKKFLEGFKGMNNYDPYFGENFYNDSFNANVDYEKLLSNIKCKTLFMKANTTIGESGLIQGALTDEDLEKVSKLISNIEIEYFDCGHGIHTDKQKQFIKSLNKGTVLLFNKNTMKKEKCCGCIIIEDKKVLLVQQDEGHWGFPKGHVEENETEEKTAIREVKEETNLDVEIQKDKRYTVEYTTLKGKAKEVVFFIAKKVGGTIKPQEQELKQVKWLDFEEAVETLTYEDVKRLFKEVLKDLNKGTDLLFTKKY